MELILHLDGMLPRPAQRGFARSYLLHPRIDPSNRRTHHDHRVFPEFSPAETSHLFTAAAAASAATALSLEALKNSAIFSKLTSTVGDRPEEDSANENSPNTRPESPVPCTVKEIWSAAWAGLEENQNNSTSTTIASMDNDSESAPITTPLLWLQGLRGDARRKLLALSLAALETAIKNNKIKSSSLDSIESSCNLILRESTAAAAKAWLGYIPSSLEQALVEKSINSKDTNSSSDGDGSRGSRGKQETELDDDDDSSSNFKVDWYALEERLGVYCSVIRLVQSTRIITSPSFQGSSMNTEYSTKKKIGRNEEKESINTATATASSALSLRATAEASLLQSSISTSLATFSTISPSSPIINGWRATQAGTKSQSQLFFLAPSVLQDMAVRISDVVAAAYLAEAAQGTWSPSSSNSSILPTNSGGTAKFNKRASININYIDNNATAVVTKLNSDGFSDGSNEVDVATTDISNSSQQHNEQQLEEAEMEADLLSPSTSLEASWWPIFAHPRIASTRQLQRFSNRLLLSRWIDTTFHSVVAAYDDRLPLFTLCSPGGLLRVRQAPVRRAAQLSALTGLRYYVSLILEAVDAAAPTLRILWERATGAVAWLLTYGLGKGIGLVWKGLKIGMASAANGSGSSSSKSGSNKKNASTRGNLKRGTTQWSDDASDTGGSSSGSLVVVA